MTDRERRDDLEWIEVTSVGDVLVRGAARWPDKDALVFPGERRTYIELYRSAEHVARSLLGLGARGGDRVGILMPNCFDFVECLFGCELVGISPVLINARYKARELEHVLRDSGLCAVLTTDLIGEYVDFAQLLSEVEHPPRLRHLVLLGQSTCEGFLGRAELGAAAAAVPSDEVRIARERVRVREEGLLMYTSGTTSMPKGCVISHEALVRTAIEAAHRWQLRHDERFWNVLPFFHMGGTFPLLAHFHVGATVMTQTHFEPGEALRMMEAERCTFAYPTFPTITQALIHHPDFDRTDLSSVRLVNDTGPPEILRAVQERFPNAPVITLYGITEASGGVSWSGPDDPYEERMTTGGFPFRGTDVRIVDPETRAVLPPGERGEILVKGPGLFDRYHNDPERTAELVVDGWFATGDLGTVDRDGRLTYLGRSKDMLKVGGENVAALEIEAFLGTHPAVKIAQVVGVPDPKYLEVPAAFVELVEGASASCDELVEFCRGAIASFKVPRFVRFVDEWPMSASKIQKFRLREELLGELGIETEPLSATPVRADV